MELRWSDLWPPDSSSVRLNFSAQVMEYSILLRPTCPTVKMSHPNQAANKEASMFFIANISTQ
jgi:hypothetical protein